MTRRTIKINSVNEACEFSRICSLFNCYIGLENDTYNINAKSIMGVFSMDLRGKLELFADTDETDKVDKAFEAFMM